MDSDEIMRLDAMMAYERAAAGQGYRLVAGIDEVGRGPLAGPVVSAAVILPERYYLEGLNDSKKLTARARDRLCLRIAQDAVAWGVGLCDSREIDEINILNATILSMERAVGAMGTQPDFLLIDAVSLKNMRMPQKSIIKGDALSISIAAASVIAKVTRDRMMAIYDSRYPGYNFVKHKGYGTREHMNKINELGMCPIHRATFCHIV
ncbi:MAG: ribonuclease HII [Oscillospiraceae bacterium]|nr:ribonuclease HII [Oscillospiraceae bacterium]